MTDVTPPAAKSRRWILFVIAGILALAVVITVVLLTVRGGTGTPTALPTATATTSPTPTPTPTPTSTPTETAEPPAPQRDLVLGEAGLDDLLLGDTADQLNASPLLEAFELDCGAGPFAAWQSAPRDGLESGTLFGVAAYDGTLRAIETHSNLIVTDRGGVVGMTTEEITGLYPEATNFAQSGDIVRHVVVNEQSVLYFDIWVGEDSVDSGSFANNHVSRMGVVPGGLDALGPPSYHPVGMSCL